MFVISTICKNCVQHDHLWDWTISDAMRIANKLFPMLGNLKDRSYTTCCRSCGDQMNVRIDQAYDLEEWKTLKEKK